MAKMKAEKAAKKALEKAKDAVAEAKRRAKKVDAKATRRAAKVEAELKSLARSMKAGARTKKMDSSSATKGLAVSGPKAVDGTESGKKPPVKKSPANKAPETSVFASTTSEDLAALTVVQLRARAREKGVTGYGKFSKAQLVASLSD